MQESVWFSSFHLRVDCLKKYGVLIRFFNPSDDFRNENGVALLFSWKQDFL